MAQRVTVGLPRFPSVPWFSRFPETNVRTYVRAADGTTGLWFFSLDAARLGAVIVARARYRIPYFWSACGSTARVRQCDTSAVGVGPDVVEPPAWSRSTSASASR